MGLSKESIIDCLRESYGESVTSAEIKAFCNMNDFNYQTITNKLTEFKTGRGRWNLEVTTETVEELEVTYNWEKIIQTALMSFILAIIASLYPSYRATKLLPVEAMRSV